MLAPPEYVVSPKKSTTPITSTNVKAGDAEPIEKRGPAIVLRLRIRALAGPRGRGCSINKSPIVSAPDYEKR
jgi:hypothetical protein